MGSEPKLEIYILGYIFVTYNIIYNFYILRCAMHCTLLAEKRPKYGKTEKNYKTPIAHGARVGLDCRPRLRASEASCGGGGRGRRPWLWASEAS